MRLWRTGQGSLEVDISQKTSSKRRLLFLFAPIALVGVVMGVASACAVSTASDAVTEVKALTEDAATLASLLPSADIVPCTTCESSGSDAHAVIAPGPRKPPAIESDKTEGGVTPASIEPPERAAVAAPRREGIPLDAPRCDGISAYIITVFEKAKHSVASLSSDPQRQAIRRREGQMFGEYRVAKIDFNRRKMSSAVWLENDAGLCQVLLRDDHPKREKINRAAVRRQERKARRLRLKRKRRNKKRR